MPVTDATLLNTAMTVSGGVLCAVTTAVIVAGLVVVALSLRSPLRK